MDTAPTMPSIMSGSLMRATPPCARMSAGTRSSAMTATAPASSAILACSGGTTSMITPPLSISAMPRLTRAVPTTGSAVLVEPVLVGAVLIEGVLGWSCWGTEALAAGGDRLVRARPAGGLRGTSVGNDSTRSRCPGPDVRPITSSDDSRGEARRDRVVDLHHPRQWRVPREPRQPHHPFATHLQRLRHRVVVEAPGPLHPGAGLPGQGGRRGGERHGTHLDHVRGAAEAHVERPGQVVLAPLDGPASLEPLRLAARLPRGQRHRGGVRHEQPG